MLPLAHEPDGPVLLLPTPHVALPLSPVVVPGLLVNREYPAVLPPTLTGSPSMYVPTYGSASVVEVTSSFIVSELLFAPLLTPWTSKSFTPAALVFPTCTTWLTPVPPVML